MLHIVQPTSVSAAPVKTMSNELLSQVYDALYDEADRLLRRENPCNIRQEDGEMVCNGSYKFPTPEQEHMSAVRALRSCCLGCEHFVNGCTVKALNCKLWLCPEVSNERRNEKVVIALNTLRRLGTSMGLPINHGHDSRSFRQSKPQIMKWVR